MPFTSIIFFVLIFAALYLQIFYFVTFLENYKKIKKPGATKKDLKRTPSVTVIVPCWNEEETLGITIDSLINLNYPKKKLQFFIVDDGSTDGTLALAHELAKTDPRISVYTKENGGKHTALNLGLTHVTSEFVGCLDADSYVDENALTEIIKTFEDESVKAVVPGIKIAKPKSVMQRIQKAEYNVNVLLRKVFGLLGALQVTPGPFSIFRKSVFDELGVYHKAHNTEDMEMALRLHSNHYRIENTHRAVVYTKGPKTFRKLHRQRVRWMYGFLMNVTDYRKLLFNKKYGNVGMLVLPAGILGIISVLYLIAMVIFNITEAVSNKILQVQTVGWHWGVPFTHFSWFSINTGWVTFLGLFLIISSVFLVFLGKKISEGTWRPSFGLVLFLIFYAYMACTWITRSVYNFVLARGKESW